MAPIVPSITQLPPPRPREAFRGGTGAKKVPRRSKRERERFLQVNDNGVPCSKLGIKARWKGREKGKGLEGKKEKETYREKRERDREKERDEDKKRKGKLKRKEMY